MNISKSSRILSLILAALLLASSFTACSESKNTAETTGTPQSADVTAETEETTVSEESAPEEIVNTRLNIPDTLPADLSYDGQTVTIYYSNSRNRTGTIEGAEELTGEVVTDAVIECNHWVADRLDVDLQFYAENTGNWDTIAALVGNLIMANDDTFDIYIGEQFGMAQNVTKGYYRNTLELKYLDFDQPWWNTTYMENLQFTRDNRMFLLGEFTLSGLGDLFTHYFNKNIYQNNFGNPDDLYNLVLDGKWTIDKMSELAEAAYVDANGNGEVDPDDQLGYVANQTFSTVDPFMYSAGIPYTSIGEDGLVTINLNQERAYALTEKTVNLFHQKGTYTQTTTLFQEGKALFLNSSLRDSSKLRDMTDNFGFLPTPKLDEEQDSYYSLVGDCAFISVIPVTCADADRAAAVLEALNAQTYRTVSPAWYEVNLKLKYSRDIISSDIIDLIHDSIYSSFLYAYAPLLNYAGQIMRELVTNNETQYASKVKSMEKPLMKKLSILYKDIENAQNP